MIGIFGDSFASVDRPILRSWTGLLDEIMQEGYVCYGEPSTSIWWSYEIFLKNYKKFDKIVFTYSHYSRWSYLPEHLADLSMIRPSNIFGGFEKYKDNSKQKYVDILLKAHPLLYSEELQLFTYQNIFNSVNKICKENNIQLINLMPFEHDSGSPRGPYYGKILYINLSQATGVCLTGLVEIAHREVSRVSIPDTRASHLSPDDNQHLAEIIAENFNDNQPKIKDLREDSRFLHGTTNENR